MMKLYKMDVQICSEIVFCSRIFVKVCCFVLSGNSLSLHWRIVSDNEGTGLCNVQTLKSGIYIYCENSMQYFLFFA